jgi:tetratricopeptide (TPR) repeat protein
MRQGLHSEALHELEDADRAAALLSTDSATPLRVATGAPSSPTSRAAIRRERDHRPVALAIGAPRRLGVRRVCATHPHRDPARARRLRRRASRWPTRAIAVAERSGDDYVIVQILNVLGAVHFDRATAKLEQPHARAHLSSLDPGDVQPMEADAREALRLFQRARRVAERARYTFAAWYVAGNIERIEILLGHAERAIRPMRRRLAKLQARGATYDEIVTRSNLAWGLRTLGQHRDALHELDVALDLARRTGTSNVLLEFLEYDRSIVLDALGDTTAGTRELSPLRAARRRAESQLRRPRRPASLRRHRGGRSSHSSSSAQIGSLRIISARHSACRNSRTTAA